MTEIEEVTGLPKECPDCGIKINLRRSKFVMQRKARLLLLIAMLVTLVWGAIVIAIALLIMALPFMKRGSYFVWPLIGPIALAPGSIIATKALRAPKIKVIKCHKCGSEHRYIRSKRESPET